jgi:hypothetical protein
MNSIFPPDFTNSTFVAGTQERIPTIELNGMTTNRTFDELVRDCSTVLDTSRPVGISGSSVFDQSTATAPPAPAPIPENANTGTSGAEIPANAKAHGLGSSAYEIASTTGGA